MKREKFNALQRGDMIQHATTGQSFVVIDSNGRGRVTIARTVDAMNPDEWERRPDLDDPRFQKRPNEFAGVFDDVCAEAERRTAGFADPEAGLTMGEPESTPASTPVDFRYRANPDVGVIPAEVPADCLGAGVLHIPKRCAEVGEAGQVYRKQDGEPESTTTRTFSVTTTTSPAEPLARALLASPTCSASNDDVKRVALNLERLAYRSRNRGAGEALVETTCEAEEQVERTLTGNTTSTTTQRPSPFENARPVETFDEVARLIEHGVGVVPRSYDSPPLGDYLRSVGAWGEWGKGPQGIGVEVRPQVVDDGSYARFFPPENEPTVRLGRKALDALRGPFDAGALPTVPVATWRDATPVRDLLFPTAVAAPEGPRPYDWRAVAVWNSALETWVDPFQFEVVVGAQQ